MNIEDLLDSRPESVLMTFLLIAPPRSFSLFELGKRLNMPEKTVLTRALSLVEKGYVKRFVKNGTSYLIVNQKHPIFPEIRKSLVQNSNDYKDELFTAIQKLGKVDAAFLSGLFVGQPKLPVDLLVVGNINPKKMEKFLENCQTMTQQEINYTVMSRDEFEERRHTFDRFIKDIFDYPYVTVVDKIKI